MCTTCLRSGWRGILERGKQLIAALPISQDSKKSFTSRLKRLWDFIRLQLHLHKEEQSPIAAHCSRLQVGSLAEPRFNQPCTHKHANPDTRLPAPEAPQHQPHCLRSGMQDLDIRQRVGGFLDLTGRLSLSATCRQYRGYWTQEAEESVWTRGHPPPCLRTHQKNVVVRSAGQNRLVTAGIATNPSAATTAKRNYVAMLLRRTFLLPSGTSCVLPARRKWSRVGTPPRDALPVQNSTISNRSTLTLAHTITQALNLNPAQLVPPSGYQEMRAGI